MEMCDCFIFLLSKYKFNAQPIAVASFSSDNGSSYKNEMKAWALPMVGAISLPLAQAAGVSK